MANRIVGNVVIVDSAMGNLGLFMGTDNITKYNVIGFGFEYTTTASTCSFSHTNTTDVIAKFSILAHVGSGGLIANPKTISLASPLSLDVIKVPTLTTGTAWVYLG